MGTATLQQKFTRALRIEFAHAFEFLVNPKLLMGVHVKATGLSAESKIGRPVSPGFIDRHLQQAYTCPVIYAAHYELPPDDARAGECWFDPVSHRHYVCARVEKSDGLIEGKRYWEPLYGPVRATRLAP